MENAEREGGEVGDVTQGGLKGVARASGLALFKLVGTGADFTAGETGRPIRILLAPKSDQVGHMSSSNGLRYPYLFMSVSVKRALQWASATLQRETYSLCCGLCVSRSRTTILMTC